VADGSERTAEEREAARLERERRRTGLPASPAEPEPPAEPDPANDGDLVEDLPTPAPSLEHDEADWDDGEHEVASGTRRVGWRERPAVAATERPPRKHRWRWRILAVLALVLVAALIWFLIELFQPFHGSGHGSVTVRIPPHSSSTQVGDLLERDGVIASSVFFEVRTTLAGDRGKLLAGTYHLRYDMTYEAVLKALTTAPTPAKVTGVTIVPGSARAQIAARLRAERVRGSYLADTRRSALLHPTAYGAPRNTPSLEGFLFPNTYELRVPISIPVLVAAQLRQFKQQFGTVNSRYARSQHLTAYDVLIIASIIEKEAATDHDFPLVASVIYNRLRDHIPLGMDSTTRYEFNDYNTPLTQAQLSSASPYNTRLHDGLPPTPISNPGMTAINAAAHPAHTNFLYFVVKPCGNGESVFSSNYQQFLRDSAQYQSARAKNGGRSPTRC
jgi:UPF0755 protein